MRKNTASQAIGAQMISASDGSAFTGSVTVYVTGDAGTQAVGSVGSGSCTHEGNGYHTYAPAQAETNYNLIAFTFTGSGAIPQTVQVFTTANLISDTQSGLATSSALATAQTDLDTLTGVDGATLATSQPNYAPAKAGNQMDLVNAPNATAITAIQNGLSTLDAAAVNAECDTAIADASLATATNLATVDTVVDAIKVKTDQLTFTKTNELDANIQSVNDVTVNGDGQSGTEWGP